MLLIWVCVLAYSSAVEMIMELCPPHTNKKGFRRFTLQSSQQSPCAHTAPGLRVQVVALQHGFVHS